ncbi:TetR/AcrR family transcriptional regulator [Salinarimonas rosea]|uniref:TetR/AcrR family transcriptional regulator n=1 Tax=Salinarimonas rosea TaxID=552063 RepID=UPI00048E2BBA|nr:TetR/AcrR family transcriptional regulator [Salinarimonas rosea]
MQMKSERRSNAERTRAMRDTLIATARALFAEHGFAETSTPALVAAAGVTRGALYHHFVDKRALFRAVVEAEATAVAEAIEASDDVAASPLERLLAGADAYLRAMAEPGRTRLLLVEAPAVLGESDRRTIEETRGDATLREGLAAAIAAGALQPLPLAVLAPVLSAALERAAEAMAAGAAPEDCRTVIRALIDGLA